MRRTTQVTIASISALLLAGSAVSAAKPDEMASLFKISGSFADFSKVLIVKGLRVMGNAAIHGAIENPGAKPVTIGDDLRVDGKIFRGPTAGASDSKPLKIDDNVVIDGNLTVNGALIADTMSELLGQKGLTHISANQQTSWSGDIYDVCSNKVRVTKIHVTFTPSSDTAGTWTSSPHNVFHPGCLTDAQGEYSGSYDIHDNVVMAFNVMNPNGSSSTTGYTDFVSTTDGLLTIVDTRTSPEPYTVLRRD